MQIMAFDGKFGVGMMMHGVEYKWNKDNTLSLWSKGKAEPYHVHVTTNRGDFIEAIDKSGAVIMEGGDGDWFYVPIGKEPIRLRFKELPKPQLSKAEIDKARQVVTRYLVSDAPYMLSIPETLPGAIAWMQKQLKAIPQACRDKTRFCFDTTMEHGETYPNIRITYSEPETDQEVITRLQIEGERSRIKENGEREEFRKLKSKFCAA